MRAYPRPSAVASVAALLALAGGCSEEDTVTVLNPAGPPAIAQLFVQEAGASGPQLAFGGHPSRPDDDRTVSRAAPLQDVQKIRIVMDELLVGNTLEQIECNNPLCDPEDQTAVCDMGVFQDVPDGTTSDDLRECTGIFDEDLVNCQELCFIDGVAEGVRTEADATGNPRINFRIRHNADDQPVVRVVCDGQDMPYDTDRSFWNPSGNQQIPASEAGIEGLGPAIVIEGINLKAASECVLEFDPTVVDKDGNQVCAPDDGDFINGACTPGDLSGLAFTVDDLRASTSPSDGAGAVRIRPGRDQVLFQFNALLDEQEFIDANITVENTPPSGAALAFEFEPVPQDENGTLVVADSRLGTGFTSLTDYVVTIPTTVTDIFDSPLKEPIVLEFTTGPLSFDSDAADGEIVGIDGPVVADFTVALDPASVPGRVTLTDTGRGTTVTTQIELVDNEIRILPDASPAFFATGSSYEVAVLGGSLGVLDIGGGPLPIESEEDRAALSFSFTTAPFNARFPADAPSRQPVDQPVELEFFAVVDAATLAGNITIVDSEGTPFVDFTAAASDNIVSIQPNASFAADTEYTITVTGGVAGVRATDGSELAEDLTFEFTTEEAAP